MSIDLHLLEKGGRLEPFRAIIAKAFNEVVIEIREKISVDDVDVIVADNPGSAIQETGVGGNAHTSHLVMVSINPEFPDIEKSLDQELRSTLAHELNHCARMAAGAAWGTLLDALVTEGLADHFDLEINGGKPKPWSVAVGGNELARMRMKCESEFASETYDHNAWFFGSPYVGIPRWAGYSLGFDLVKRYLEKTGKKASELILVDSKEFSG